MTEQPPKVKGLRDRLKDGEHIICAEGYLIEFERRCYLKSGAFVPEVVLEHPHLVTALHEEFVHAGSDVVEAYTYYGHRAKLALLGKEDQTEELNRRALRIAKEVAVRKGKLMAGNLSNTTIYTPGNERLIQKVRDIFKEQVEWAVEEGADYIIGETFFEAGEAYLALDCINKYGKGLPAVITMMALPDLKMQDDIPLMEACKTLEERGAAVVGINCSRGPDSALPVVKEIRKVCKGPIACVPSPYRTTMECPCYQDLKDQRTGKMSFPDDMDSWLCSRTHITDFTNEIKDAVQYMGLCCGNRSHYTRAMSMALGRTPESAKWMADYSTHMSRVEHEDYAYAREKYNTKFMAREDDA